MAPDESSLWIWPFRGKRYLILDLGFWILETPAGRKPMNRFRRNVEMAFSPRNELRGHELVFPQASIM